MHATVGMGEAARLTGKSKSTLTRAVKAGRLSADRDEGGAYRVAVAELERVYPLTTHRSAPDAVMHHALEREASGEASDAPTGAREDAVDAEVAVLRAQLALLRNQLDDAKDARDDARAERDEWRDQARATQRLLEDARPVRRGWFGLMRRVE